MYIYNQKSPIFQSAIVESYMSFYYDYTLYKTVRIFKREIDPRYTEKNLKRSCTRKIAVTVLKFEQRGLTIQ